MSPREWFKMDSAVASREDLSPAAKIIFALLKDYIGDNGVGWPGMRRLATEAGVDKSTVSRAVCQLAETGLIEAEPGGKGQATRYKLGDGTVRKMRTLSKPKVSAKCVHSPKTGCPQNADTGVRKMRTLVSAKCVQIKKTIEPDHRCATVPAAPSRKDPGFKTAVGETVKLWFDEFEKRTGAKYAGSAGQLAGRLSDLIWNAKGDGPVKGAVKTWFNAPARPKGYGFGLFLAAYTGHSPEVFPPARFPEATPEEIDRVYQELNADDGLSGGSNGQGRLACGIDGCGSGDPGELGEMPLPF